MKKDVTYSMRMNRRMQEALKKAAERDRRSVASLLDKIIADYLEGQGLSIHQDFSEERRRFQRKKITIPSTTRLRTNSQVKNIPSVILDVSMGGALVTYPKGSGIGVTSVGELPKFDLCFDIPRTGEQVCLGCSARRLSDVGDEIQVGATFSEDGSSQLERLQTYLM